MRYRIILYLDDGSPVDLGGNSVPESREIARRMTSPGDLFQSYEILDTYTESVAETSETRPEKRKR